MPLIWEAFLCNFKNKLFFIFLFETFIYICTMINEVIKNDNPQILSEELKHFSNWLVNQNIMISETINGNRWRENKMGYGYINHEVLVDRYLSGKSNPTVKIDDVGEIVEYIGNNNSIRGKHYTLLAIEDDYGALCKCGSETMRFRVDEIKLVFKRK